MIEIWIHTGIVDDGDGFALLPPSATRSGGGRGLATLLDPGTGSGAFARSGRFGGGRGGVVVDSSSGFFAVAGSGEVAGFGLGDFAESFQVLLDGAGGAGGCVGRELERGLGM